MMLKNELDIERINSILQHMKMVESISQKLAKKLLPTDRALALKLIKLGRTHDLSKFNSFEFQNLNREPWTSTANFERALRIHHKNNKHHPEYWDSIHDMPDEYVAEMVCDCFARSQQFGTSVTTWFKKKMTKIYDFKMTDPVGIKIQTYLNFLLDPIFTKTKIKK